MSTKKRGDFIGYSDLSIQDAVENALKKAGNPMDYEIVDTSCIQCGEHASQYQVLLVATSEGTY